MSDAAPSGSRTKVVVGVIVLVVAAVAVIVVSLASVVVVSFSGQDDKAKVQRVRADFKGLEVATNMFRQSHGRWPASIEELMKPPVDPLTGRSEPFLETLPIDPWTTRKYMFRRNNDEMPFFMSYGADQRVGGEGPDADIRSDQLR